MTNDVGYGNISNSLVPSVNQGFKRIEIRICTATLVWVFKMKNGLEFSSKPFRYN